jgi:23S rRNA pseudouridine955/2504/2580 synthase
LHRQPLSGRNHSNKLASHQSAELLQNKNLAMSSNNSEYQPSRIITIEPDQAGQRIDNYLVTLLKGIPKTRVYKMLRKGEVRVNKGRIKPVYRLKDGDQVRIPPVHLAEKQPRVSAKLSQIKALESLVIYESDRLLVLNKPSGMAVHGGSGQSFGVIEALRSLRPEAHYLELVHRLDKDTSGCLLIAKKRSTLRFLHEQLREHRIQKVYQAWVWGDWPADLKVIDQPLQVKRYKDGERKALVDADGKPSKTLFNKLETRGEISLVEARPVTGRMHQIRVHCLWAGHPICGDPKYLTDKELRKRHPRLYLHARELHFREQVDSPLVQVTAESPDFDLV